MIMECIKTQIYFQDCTYTFKHISLRRNNGKSGLCVALQVERKVWIYRHVHLYIDL
jgi:hypothetical protein